MKSKNPQQHIHHSISRGVKIKQNKLCSPEKQRAPRRKLKSHLVLFIITTWSHLHLCGELWVIRESQQGRGKIWRDRRSRWGSEFNWASGPFSWLSAVYQPQLEGAHMTVTINVVILPLITKWLERTETHWMTYRHTTVKHCMHWPQQNSSIISPLFGLLLLPLLRQGCIITPLPASFCVNSSDSCWARKCKDSWCMPEV